MSSYKMSKVSTPNRLSAGYTEVSHQNMRTVSILWTGVGVFLQTQDFNFDKRSLKLASIDPSLITSQSWRADSYL